MSLRAALRELTPRQRHVIIAGYLGWTLDAFDFFVLVFVMKDIAAEFTTTVKAVTYAITLTLAMRPLGALIFGALADRFGRRPVLMANVLFYSVMELASGFAPSLSALIALRALYGVAMGGEWGVGASLVMETIPEKLRGTVSGLLQAGYPSGYLLASLVFYFLYPHIDPHYAWRVMFMAGAAPALLVLYIRRFTEESPVFTARRHRKERVDIVKMVKDHAGLFLWAAVMMAGFNFLSHGTQDVYPTFLQQQRHLTHDQVGGIAIVYNIGAILGGLFFGTLSEKIGRRKAIVLAARLVLPAIPFWVHALTPVGLACGAFAVQFFVQGAWGVVPAHLNEISPDAVRGTFPGVVYQLGNLIASGNATMQADIATRHNGDYGFALALVAGCVAVLLTVITWLGAEKHGQAFGVTPAPE
ncbi:MAG: MFS transporter [Alphaproteobacteria bacterium]|nr:MFS transporter [Alphaproteobacteria bacterium]